MGLLDWFRRKKERIATDELADIPDQPRPQYYYYAHYVLRDATFEMGAACPGVLLSPQKEEFLREMWKHTTAGVREQDPKAKLDELPSIEVLPLRAGKFPCVVLKMPEPKGMTECHFVGMVIHFDPATEDGPNEQTPMSYFTLERGVGEDMKTPRTVLCEWSKEGTHSNYGDGPPPEAQSFANAVGQKLAGRGYAVQAKFAPPEEP